MVGERFSSDAALAALADAVGASSGPTVVRIGTVDLRTITLRDEPVLEHRLIDFFEPLEPSVGRLGEPTVPGRFVPRLARRSVSSAQWATTKRPEQVPSPYVDWSDFADWDAFQQASAAHRSNLWTDSRRRWRKLAKELGEVEFREHDEDPQAFASCLEWKVAQYDRTGAPNSLADPTARAYLDALRATQLLQVSTLRSGGRLVAAHIGLHDQGRRYWWLPAYDPELEAYSPGRLLLHALLEQSQAAGDSEFDFLYGDEPYKWWYATDVRVVEPFGAPSVPQRVRELRRTLPRRYPAVGRHGGRAMGVLRRLRRRVGSATALGAVG